ncbi:hypothetical protein BB559_003130 [Furculomyces boomerangus]|uniref:Post-GPI attachment to proteins factor 3 n=2 Tax=Harpellales TaxID=61421 RepID=A0A2T9YNP7_9FUNG|nr:hypothetical protein BB559_003130 [Furculomyces boomerangus]
MLANAAVGLLANVAWMAVAYRMSKAGENNYLMPVTLILLTDLAFSLEAFDFPPLWDTFDAHSLWHAATIPITFYWYRWLIDVFPAHFSKNNQEFTDGSKFD